MTKEILARHEKLRKVVMRHIFILFIMISTILASDTVTIGKLQWQDDSKAKSIKRDWNLAKAHCKELSLAGKNDWRLPTITELYSIVDIKRFEPAIKKKIKNVTFNYYWSSSEYASDEMYAWYVYFGSGSMNRNSKSTDFFVRCVRDK